MIIWINGTFGVGKTTTGKALIADQDKLRFFDPEQVGYMLTRNLADQDIHDFQDLPAWRELVPVVARRIQEHTGQDLVAVQSVLDQNYWTELQQAFQDLNEPLLHVVLDADAQTLENRINNDDFEVGAKQWRLEHIEEYLNAREWMLRHADLVIDTRELEPTAIAAMINAAAHEVSR